MSEKLQTDYHSSIILSDLSDHLPCYLEIEDFSGSKSESRKILKRKLNKDNLNKIKMDIESIDWETLLSNKDATDSFNKVHNAIIESLDRYAPEKEVLIQNKRQDKPWISKAIANSIRKSKILFKESTIDQTLKPKYQDFLKTLKMVKRAAKLQYYQQKFKDFRQNTKKLCELISKINKKANDKSTLTPQIVKENITYKIGNKVSNVLAKHFASVGKKYAERIKTPHTPLHEYLNKIPVNIKNMYFSPTTETEPFVYYILDKKSKGQK